MKHLVRISLLGLAAGMVAALALAAPTTTRAGVPVPTCAALETYCINDPFWAQGLELCMLEVGSDVNLSDCGYCALLDAGWDQCAGPYSGLGCANFYSNSQAVFNQTFTAWLDLSCANPCGDDRVNENCSAPEIVYCNGDDAEFYKYDYDALEAYFDFSIPLADLQQSVAVKTLIKKVGTVSVFLMPDGRVLLVAQQTDLKDYFMFWDPSTCASLQEGAEWGID